MKTPRTTTLNIFFLKLHRNPPSLPPSIVLGQEAAPLHAAALKRLPPLLDVHLVLVLQGADDVGPREGAAAQGVSAFLSSFGGGGGAWVAVSVRETCVREGDKEEEK